MLAALYLVGVKGWMDSVAINELVTLLDSCIKHLLCSTPPLASPVPQITLATCFTPVATAETSSAWALLFPTVLIGQWCLASCGAMGHSSVTSEALRHHAAKERLEVNSPWGEPLINGRQRMVINSSPFLFPSGGTVLRGSSSHARHIKTVLQDWATSHDETKQWPDEYHPLLCVLPPSLLHSPFSLSCSPGTMLLSEAAAHKHLLQAQPFGEARVRTHHTNVRNTIPFACWLHVLPPIYLPHWAPEWMQ